MSRGASSATKKAIAFAEKNPSVPAKEIAKKFGIDPSTVYRWKNNQKNEHAGRKN